MRIRGHFVLGFVFLTTFVVVASLILMELGYFSHLAERFAVSQTAGVAEGAGSLSYSFSRDGVLHEAGSPEESTSPYWWLNSGGMLVLKDGVGKTVDGELPSFHRWRRLYANTNPTDTDNGAHPQNLLRLITKSVWDDLGFEGRFRVTGDNLSESPNRNESNGIFLMSRYQDTDDFYYAGVRVDGHAVIKKKYGGMYHTLTETEFYPGDYDRDKNPTLLPHDTWIRMRLETVTENGTVHLVLRIRDEEANMWREAAVVTDSGQYGGTPPLLGPAAAGVRSDFMDVEFDSLLLEEL